MELIIRAVDESVVHIMADSTTKVSSIIWLYQQKQCFAFDVTLFHKSRKLIPTDTCQEAGLSSGDILYAAIGDYDYSEHMTVLVRCPKHALEVNIYKNLPLTELMMAYRSKYSLTTGTFLYNQYTIKGHETPTSLGLKEDDIIQVVY